MHLQLRHCLFSTNIFKSYNIPIPKKALITGLVIGEAVLQFCTKVFFINCVPNGTGI